MLLAAVATCGGAPPILGLELFPTMGHLLTSCLLPWVPGKEKILLGDLPTMGGPEADAGQKLGWVCNFLPYITGAGSSYIALLAPGPEPLKASTS